MTEQPVVNLSGVKLWQDTVGSRFVEAAEGSVARFNEESLALWEQLEKLESFRMEDIQHEPLKRHLMEMRVEFHG